MSSLESTAERRKDRYIGQQINNLRLTDCIGVGGFGAVYRAEHEKLGTAFAVKLLHLQHLDNSKLVQRFEREARTIAQLSHPHIIRVSDFGQTEDGSYYLVMDFLSGQPLGTAIERGHQFTVAELRNLFRQIGSALEYVHRKNIVHRDLKPENIFLEMDGHNKEYQAKILDFGIAGIAREPTLTGTGTVLGSPLYMSPEQIQGNTKEADARSDLYSLGIVLFQALTGEAPFVASDLLGVLYKHIHDPVPLLHERRPALAWSRELQAFLQRALAKQPEQRFQTAEEFTKALDAALAKQEERTPQISFPQRLGVETIAHHETILPTNTPIRNPSFPRNASLPSGQYADSLQFETPHKTNKLRYALVFLVLLLFPIGWFGYAHFASRSTPSQGFAQSPKTLSPKTHPTNTQTTKTSAGKMTVPSIPQALPEISPSSAITSPPPPNHPTLPILPKNLAIALANGILAYPAKTPNLPPHSFTIKALPEDAAFWQGNTHIGNAPIALVGPVGTAYKLQIKAPNYIPKEVSGNLPSTEPFTQTIILERLVTTPSKSEDQDKELALRRKKRRRRKARRKARRKRLKELRKQREKQSPSTEPPKRRLFEIDVFK